MTSGHSPMALISDWFVSRIVIIVYVFVVNVSTSTVKNKSS